MNSDAFKAMKIGNSKFSQETSQKTLQNSVLAAFFGFAIDVFDLFLPIIILMPASAYFSPPKLVSPLLQSIIFIVALLGRPVGTLCFGYMADKFGRKRMSTLTMNGLGVCVLITGLLPGYQTIGMLSLVALLCLRFLTGFFAGGQYTGAVTLAMESCPRSRRGLYGGFIGGASNLSYIVMSGLGLILFHLMPPNGLDSAYVQWGWRIPFFIGALLALGFHSYVTHQVQESPRWIEERGQGHQFLNLFSGVQFGKLLQGFVLMNGVWLVCLVPTAVMPGVLRNMIGLSPIQTTEIMLVAAFVTFFGFLLGGVISDHIGRRTAFVVHAALAGTVGACALYFLARLSTDRFDIALLLATITYFLEGLVWGSGPHSYLNERFHTGNRSSGYGIAFSFAVVLPSFYDFYLRGLNSVLPVHATPSVLFIIANLIVIVAALAGPETFQSNNLDGKT